LRSKKRQNALIYTTHTHAHTGVAPAPATIARDLEKQAADPNSPLRSGKLTSYTKGIQVFYEEEDTCVSYEEETSYTKGIQVFYLEPFNEERLDTLQARVLGGVVTEGTGGVERIGRGAVRDLTQQLRWMWMWVWVWVWVWMWMWVWVCGWYLCMYECMHACIH